MAFNESVLAPFWYVFDPTKRLFFVYLLAAVFLGFAALLVQEKNIKQSLLKLVNNKIWQHSSTQIDIYLLFFNALVRSVLLLFITLSSFEVAQFVVRALHFYFPETSPVALSYSWVMALYSVVSFVFLDFTRFFQHYLFHKIPFLWRFHKIHHSAQVMTPLTLYRTHPVESLVSFVRRTLVVGFVSGIFIFYTKSIIGAYAILGVNAFDFLFNFLGSNLRHSHIWLSFGPLNHLFVSPAQHQIHHSRHIRHRDKNLGFALSLWDKMFGTFYQVHKKEFLIFGIGGERHKSFKQSLLAPFYSQSNNKKTKGLDLNNKHHRFVLQAPESH